MAETHDLPRTQPQLTREEKQRIVAGNLMSGKTQTPIPPMDFLQPPQPSPAPTGVDQTRAESEVKLQRAHKDEPLPETLTRVTNAAMSPEAVAAAISGQPRPDGLSEKQTAALNRICEVRAQAFEHAGKPGVNPFVFDKETLKPLEAAVKTNQANTIEFVLTQLVCPEKPGSFQKPGPIMMTEAERAARAIRAVQRGDAESVVAAAKP